MLESHTLPLFSIRISKESVNHLARDLGGSSKYSNCSPLPRFANERYHARRNFLKLYPPSNQCPTLWHLLDESTCCDICWTKVLVATSVATFSILCKLLIAMIRMRPSCAGSPEIKPVNTSCFTLFKKYKYDLRFLNPISSQAREIQRIK